jgi:hypothetical protein
VTEELQICHYLGRLNSGEAQRHCCSFAYFAHYCSFAMMQIHNGFDDCQSQALHQLQNGFRSCLCVEIRQIAHLSFLRKSNRRIFLPLKKITAKITSIGGKSYWAAASLLNLFYEDEPSFSIVNF